MEAVDLFGRDRACTVVLSPHDRDVYGGHDFFSVDMSFQFLLIFKKKQIRLHWFKWYWVFK